MLKLLKLCLFIFFITTVLSGCTLGKKQNNSVVPTDFSLIIGEQKFKVDIADTPVLQAQGLSGRSVLAENEGMLFILPELSNPGFWMKDMNFPIDIIWIKDNQIIDWVSAFPVPAGEQLPIYYPPEPIDKVLEINVGYLDKMSIRKGDNIVYSSDLDSLIHMR